MAYKTIRFSGHAFQQLKFRGVSEKEVIETIHSGKWLSTGEDRMECKKDFIFNSSWQGKYYHTKQVRPIFTEENLEIVVVTVYSYYF